MRGALRSAGLVSYTFFRTSTPVYARSAVEAPSVAGVQFLDTTAGVIFGQGGFENIINDAGGSVTVAGPAAFIGMTAIGQLAAYP